MWTPDFWLVHGYKKAREILAELLPRRHMIVTFPCSSPANRAGALLAA